jgi:NAD(P)-dependent dehydrogenase (short-subunit alcohol dehydrogenase family)
MLSEADGGRLFFPKPFLDHQEADYDRYMKLNKAFFFITQKVAANLVAVHRPGAIVNIGSMWAKQAIAATPSSAYSMAKAGLHSLTQHMAMELALSRCPCSSMQIFLYAPLWGPHSTGGWLLRRAASNA